MWGDGVLEKDTLNSRLDSYASKQLMWVQMVYAEEMTQFKAWKTNYVIRRLRFEP